MLLRSSISGAKKFFRKTFHNVKSFFNGDNYEKLPKATQPTTPSPFTLNPNPSSNNPNIHQTRAYDANKLEKLYVDFTETWDSDNGTRKRRSIGKNIAATTEQVPLNISNGNHQKKSNVVSNGRVEKTKGEGSLPSPSSCSRNRFLVLMKLKELEMMDVDHVLDVEEVLHYYSHLTCPTYLEIVDKFFMEIYAELFTSTTPTRTTPPSNPSSRARLGIRDGARVLRKVR